MKKHGAKTLLAEHMVSMHQIRGEINTCFLELGFYGATRLLSLTLAAICTLSYLFDKYSLWEISVCTSAAIISHCFLSFKHDNLVALRKIEIEGTELYFKLRETLET
jgi:hypothetical protein